MGLKRVVVTIMFDTDASEEHIHEVAKDMHVQYETLEDDHDAKVLWTDYNTKIEDLKED